MLLNASSPPLMWMAPALAGGGYSSESLSFAQGLSTLLGDKFVLRQFAEQPDIEYFSGFPEDLRDVIADAFEPPTNAPATRKDTVVVCHSPPDAWKPSKFPGWDQLSPCPPENARFVVGRTMFETDSVPDDWVERCNRMDAVWVPTAFHRESFLRAGVAATKLAILGEAVDTNLFDPEHASPLPLPPPPPPPWHSRTHVKSPFRFLSVFKWEARKGWDVLLRAYFEEFAPSEPVELLIKTRPFHSSDDFDDLIEDLIAEHKLPSERPAVRILDREIEMRELPRLYAAADAFVLPSRGEGWGRPHVEAMAMSLPVIATNWSGPTAFLDEEVGYPLQYELGPAASMDGHHWAEPSVAHLRALMRRVIERPDEARRRGWAARERMRTRYSPQTVGKDVLRLIRELVDADHERGHHAKDEL
jgi:glycosyltransferase involved in cell wall biosynthesis